MFEKDYLMKFINTFFDSINQIINGIESGDVENVAVQIKHSYQLLGNDSSFFISTNIEGISKIFKTKEGDYLKRIQMLSELMYYDSCIQENKKRKIILKKSVHLLEYYSQNTKEYSFEMNRKLRTIKNELEQL